MTTPTDKASQRAFSEFFSAVGYAITRWADIDRELFRLFQFTLQTDETNAAVLFYRIATIGEHLTIVDTLLKSAISDKRLSIWQPFTCQDRKVDCIPERSCA
jgi:hypothetical protein